MRKSLFLFILSLFISGVVLAQAAGPAAKLLPKTGEVKGWKVYPDTLQYARGDDLTNIYNGGYELYTRNGVVDAATQMYSKGNLIVTVTLHTMTSAKSAKSFFAYWKKESASQKPRSVSIGNGAFYYTADGATNGYLVSGRYFATIVLQAADKQAAADTQSFLKLVAKRAK